MWKQIREMLTAWDDNKNQRQKLQHTYLFASIAIIVLAGLVSLVNAELGHQLTRLAGAGLMIFLANAVIWSLLQAGVIDKLPNQKPANSTRRATKKR